ncbi:MAG: NHL repeat-containing protein [Solirubrobacteraceae bacterium]
MAAVVLAVCAGGAEANFTYERAFGQVGGGPYGFGFPLRGANLFRTYKSPTGLSVDPAGNLWVADALNSRIARFSPSGVYLGRLRARGHGIRPTRANVLPGAVFRPEGLVWSVGHLFVAMNGNDRIEEFARSGALLRIFAVRRPYRMFFGLSRGSARGQVQNPFGIARRAGITYVADLNNSRVNVYGPTGASRGQIGGFGQGPGRFIAPFGVAIGPDGSVYVSDRELNRIQRFSRSGRLIQIIGSTGSGPGQFLSPWGLATDPRGNLYVADLNNYRIQRLTGSGQFLEAFGQGLLQSPTYVAADRACHVYVSDYRRVVKFTSGGGC